MRLSASCRLAVRRASTRRPFDDHESPPPPFALKFIGRRRRRRRGCLTTWIRRSVATPPPTTSGRALVCINNAETRRSTRRGSSLSSVSTTRRPIASLTRSPIRRRLALTRPLARRAHKTPFLRSSHSKAAPPPRRSSTRLDSSSRGDLPIGACRRVNRLHDHTHLDERARVGVESNRVVCLFDDADKCRNDDAKKRERQTSRADDDRDVGSPMVVVVVARAR